MLALDVQRVAGDNGADQVGDGVQQGLEPARLARPLADVQLDQGQDGGVLQRGKQVHLAAGGPARTTQALAVHGKSPQPGRRGATVREPAADCPVQCVTVPSGQYPAHRRLRGQQPCAQQRIGARPELGEYRRRRVGDPLADGQQRSRPGQHRARGERENHGQRMAHSACSTRVGHLGEPLQQTRNLVGDDLRTPVELVKGGRDQG
ncbi:hypothetical protein OG965_38660 [Streptomyces sp. NBC_00224]